MNWQRISERIQEQPPANCSVANRSKSEIPSEIQWGLVQQFWFPGLNKFQFDWLGSLIFGEAALNFLF